MVNGLIFQKKSNISYKGVDGDNWYLNYDYPNIFNDIFENDIEKSWYDDQFVDVCGDWTFIYKYYKLSEEKHINYRIILCKTKRKYPIIHGLSEDDSHFLGYDYAYPGGSYYSAVLNDIHLRSVEGLNHFRLNKNGLFEYEEEISEFISKRTSMIAENADLESGDFIIYKLYEVETTDFKEFIESKI